MADGRNRLGALHACESGLTVDDVRIAAASASVTTLPLPTAGTWSGPPGNSAFRLSDDAIVAYRDNGGKTIRGADLNALMERGYGTASVTYRNREPDFSPFEDAVIGHVDLERFSAESRRRNFRSAEKRKAAELGCSVDAIRERMREHGLVWHEHSNGKTLSAVPAPIHAAFVHGGGISVERSNAVIEKHLAERFPNGFKLARQSETLHVEAHELERALANLKRHYQEEKRARYPRRKERSMQENREEPWRRALSTSWTRKQWPSSSAGRKAPSKNGAGRGRLRTPSRRKEGGSWRASPSSGTASRAGSATMPGSAIWISSKHAIQENSPPRRTSSAPNATSSIMSTCS